MTVVLITNHPTVPTYDARHGVALSNYDTLERITTEIGDGSAIAVIFTVTRWNYSGDLPRIDTTVMFNIQRVLLLADAPADDSQTEDDNTPDSTEQSLGVLNSPDDAQDDIPAPQPVPPSILL